MFSLSFFFRSPSLTLKSIAIKSPITNQDVLSFYVCHCSTVRWPHWSTVRHLSTFLSSILIALSPRRSCHANLAMLISPSSISGLWVCVSGGFGMWVCADLSGCFFFFFLRWRWWMWVCAGGGCRCCCNNGCWWPLLRQWWLCCCCCCWQWWWGWKRVINILF